MKIAYVFPGQGSQSPGMGSSVRERYPAAEAVARKADELLGYALGDLCDNGPEDTLASTRITQPAIFTTSIAILAVLQERGVAPDVVAGHSIGEYAAICAGGAAQWETLLPVVRQRAEAMDRAAQAAPGAMAAVLGMSYESVLTLCRQTEEAGHGVVDAANINADGQVVISGEKSAVDAASALAAELGAKRVIALAVSGGFHSRLMAPAAREMAPVIEAAPIGDARVPIVANVNAAYEQSAKQIKANLVAQIDHSVLWDQSMKRLIADGVDTFVEVGARKVLATLLKRMGAGIAVYSTNEAGVLEETIAALTGGCRA